MNETKSENTSSDEKSAYQLLWQDLQLATIFLTRLPWRYDGDCSQTALSRATKAFPLVGLIVGGFSGMSWILALTVGLPSSIAAFIAIAMTAILTGALHQDGLADVCDGFWGARDKARKLEIMRDSRIGSYGVLALILVVALQGLSLGSLNDPLLGFSVIVGAAAISRAAMTVLLHALPAARDDGLGRSMNAPSRQDVAISLSLAIIVAIACFGLVSAAMILVICTLLYWGISRLSLHHIGGQSGDVCGATQQVLETAILITCAGAFGP